MKKRLSLLLALVMLLQLAPTRSVVAWAEDSGTPGSAQNESGSEAEALILPAGEIPDKREANIKHFRMTDGSNMAVVYPAAVHFEENGDWAEIDNQLELRDDAEGGQVYVNRRNSFGVSLPAALDKESWFGVSTGGHSLFFRLLGVQESKAAVAEEPKPSEDPLERAVSVHYDSAVLYTDALPGSELRYDLGGQSLKETICFSALEFVPEELSYEIRAEGLQAEWGKDGEILFLAEDASYTTGQVLSCDGGFFIG